MEKEEKVNISQRVKIFEPLLLPSMGFIILILFIVVSLLSAKLMDKGLVKGYPPIEGDFNYSKELFMTIPFDVFKDEREVYIRIYADGRTEWQSPERSWRPLDTLPRDTAVALLDSYLDKIRGAYYP